MFIIIKTCISFSIVVFQQLVIYVKSVFQVCKVLFQFLVCDPVVQHFFTDRF